MNVMTPLVISKVVENDLCIGCGVCVQACPNDALDVSWNAYGFLVASANTNRCDSSGECIKVCPFNPAPGPRDKNEDRLAEVFLPDAPKRNNKIGHYYNLYVGYSRKFRTTSSSGGVATFVFERLFDEGLIDYVVTVAEAKKDKAHYQYSIISDKDDLISTSRTRYHPVSLAAALRHVKQLEGRVAISGVACFIKAIRLAQDNDPVLREKIIFLVGIICGGVKSKFFTDYLAQKAGVAGDNYSKPEYRVKDPDSTATDYRFSCVDKLIGSTKQIKMQEVGDMWGTGLFKANACDFCDDVVTELADISVGDAWLHPYSQDGNGHNVIVSRSILGEHLLQKGLENGELELENLSLTRFLTSQQGSFSHRHDGMYTRINLVKRAGGVVPPKRVEETKLPLYLRLVQHGRRQTRLKSLEVWSEYRTSVRFDQHMKPALLYLKIVTKLSHAIRKVKKLTGIKR